jgi:inosose dehydratase
LELTDPALLGLVFDTGHFAFGAGPEDCEQVLDGLNRFAERIWYIHFKDCQPEVAQRSQEEQWDYFKALQHGLFCELGQGCVDFATVRDWLYKHDYRGYALVEQDILPGMGAPKESARRNREYLKSIGL